MGRGQALEAQAAVQAGNAAKTLLVDLHDTPGKMRGAL
jgi:hypothetical protein